MQKVQDYLENYQDLWWEISQKGAYLPCMDVTMDMVDEDDYYGCDFTGKRQVMELFFTGSSDYFPGFFIGKDNYEDNLDQYPIYVFDLSTNEEEARLELIGNFKTYMTKLIEGYLENHKRGKFVKMAQTALMELDQFSDKMIHKEEYVLKINN